MQDTGTYRNLKALDDTNARAPEGVPVPPASAPPPDEDADAHPLRDLLAAAARGLASQERISVGERLREKRRKLRFRTVKRLRFPDSDGNSTH